MEVWRCGRQVHFHTSTLPYEFLMFRQPLSIYEPAVAGKLSSGPAGRRDHSLLIRERGVRGAQILPKQRGQIGRAADRNSPLRLEVRTAWGGFQAATRLVSRKTPREFRIRREGR